MWLGNTSKGDETSHPETLAWILTQDDWPLTSLPDLPSQFDLGHEAAELIRSRRVTFRSSPEARIRPSAESSRQLTGSASASKVTSRSPVSTSQSSRELPATARMFPANATVRIAPWPVTSRVGGASADRSQRRTIPSASPEAKARPRRPARRGPSRRPCPTRA